MTTADKIRNIITNSAGSVSFADDTPLSDLGLDSLTTIEIVMQIEDEFGIMIELSDVGKGRFSLEMLTEIVNGKITRGA